MNVSDPLILCYHAVSPSWPAPLSIAPQRLDWQLKALRYRGYEGVRFTEAVLGPASGRVVAVTFDDAYRSVLDRAKPILDRHGLPGTVFVPTDWPDAEGPMAWPGIEHWVGTSFEQELQPMSWSDLRYLSEQGWEIGSHTCSHPRLTQLSDARLAGELESSRSTCTEQVGVACRSLAYPFGDHDGRVIAAARHAGYEVAGTLPSRFPRRPHPLAFPRVGIYHRDAGWRFALKASRSIRLLRSSRVW